jgi:hypothetical protein
MLVAKREPFELGAHDRPVPQAEQAPMSSRFTRTLHILQMLGALVAVPAGLGSAYTMYKTNYSPEATCQSLRANLVAMLDRNVDASMRRALVRRDIEIFERSCGAADPDATAAFKTLLALDKARPAAAAPAATPPQQPQAAVSKVETAPAAKAEPAPLAKAEPAPAPKAKQPRAAAGASASAEPDTPMSDDAAWLAAVRSALANHQKHADPPPAAPSSLGPPLGEMTPPPVLPAAPLAAPTLPPPASIAARPASSVDPDRPVPPGAIPEAPPPDATKRRSRMGEFVSEIPFFGKALADHISR